MVLKAKSETNNRLKLMVVAGIAIAALLLGFVLAGIFHSGPEQSERVPSNADSSGTPRPDTDQQPLSDIWQWEKVDTTRNADGELSASSSTITASGLHRKGVLDMIGRIQYQGDQLILDFDARKLLESAFDKLGHQANPGQINEIQTMLKQVLPGAIGEQASDVVGRYFEYQQIVQNNDLDSLSVEESIDLREQVLGVKLNSRLYGDEQAYQRFLGAIARIDGNESLSKSERSDAVRRVKQDLNDGVFFVADASPQELSDITGLVDSAPELKDYLKLQALALSAAHKSSDANHSDWQQRYQQFDEQRRWVVEAAMVAEDKRKQLDRLYREFFSAEERAKIHDYIDPDKQP